MRKFAAGLLLALALIAPTAALAQVCPAVAALPDSERRVAYAPSASTGPFSVTFALLGDGTDYGAWAEVFLNGVRLTPVTDWQLTIPSGTLASACRPITNASITLTNAATGTLQIVGARRPRRTSQFPENAGVSARNLNQVITDITAQNRETWDKINDVSGRGLFSQPGNVLGALPLPTACANRFLGFDATGLIPQCLAGGAGSGNVVGPLTSTIGNVAIWNNATGSLLANSTVPITRLTALTDTDVFLVGGQSNAITWPSLTGPTTPAGKVLQYAGGVISDLSTIGGPWTEFGLTWFNATGRRVLFVMASITDSGQISVNAGAGGSWDIGVPGSDYFLSLPLLTSGLAAATAAGYSPVYRGVLWAQGENDAHGINIGTAGATKANYKAGLVAMIAKYRVDLALPAMPFYIFRTGVNTSEFPSTGYQQVQAAQEEVAVADLNTRVVFWDAADYPTLGMTTGAPPIHYTQAGYNRMGQVGAANILAATTPDTFRPNGDNLYWSRGSVLISPNLSALPAAAGLPLFRLANADAIQTLQQIDSFGAAVGSFLLFRHANGTGIAPTALTSGQLIGGAIFDGYGATAFPASAKAALFGWAAQNWNDVNQGTFLTLETTPNNSTTRTEAIRIQPSGGVSVGTIIDLGIGTLLALNKLSAGLNGTVSGQVVINGLTSGSVVQTSQAVAGTPTVTWGTNSGTPVVTATSPLAITAATGNLTISAIPLSSLATQAANTVVGNATAGAAAPTALSMPSCSTAASALNWTTNTGFGCNTSITAAAVPVGGITGLGSNVATFLATPSSANLAAAVTDETGTAGNLVFSNSPTLVTPAITTSTTITRTGVGVTSADGAVLQNTTAAAAGAQQWSPRTHYIAQGWKTDATAGSQTVDAIVELQSTQSTSTPSASLVTSIQLNGGGYIPITGVGLLASNGNAFLQFNSPTSKNSNLIYSANSVNKWYVQNQGDTADAYRILNSDANGNAVQMSLAQVGAATFPGYVQTGAVAVASLPACGAGTKGARHFVTDSNAASFTAGIGAVVAAGGTTNVPVTCDGTNWRIGANDNIPAHLQRKLA